MSFHTETSTQADRHSVRLGFLLSFLFLVFINHRKHEFERGQRPIRQWRKSEIRTKLEVADNCPPFAKVGSIGFLNPQG